MRRTFSNVEMMFRADGMMEYIACLYDGYLGAIQDTGSVWTGVWITGRGEYASES